MYLKYYRCRAALSCLAVMCAVAPSSVFARDDAPRESLRETLLEISARHPRVLERAGELASRLAAANYSSSRYPDPGFGVAWSNYPYKKDLRLIDDQTPMTGVEISVSQPIPFPGRLSLESKIADVDANASRLRLAIEKNQLAREFLDTLLETRSAKQTHELARGFSERIQLVAEVANARYAVGKGDLSDVSKAGVNYAVFQDRVRELEASLETRSRRLLYYLEGDAETTAGDALRARLSPVFAQSEALPRYVRGLREWIDSRPDGATRVGERSLSAALAGLEIDRQEKEKHLARMQYLPDFELFASYRRRADIANDPAQGEDFMSFGFKMRVPLWSALSNHSNVEAREELQTSARFSQRNIIQRERSLFDAARIEARVIDERLKLYTESLIPQASQSADSARLAYENGRADFDTFLSSWDLLYSLEAERIRLRVDRDKQILLMAFILNVILPDHTPQSENKPGESS